MKRPKLKELLRLRKRTQAQLDAAIEDVRAANEARDTRRRHHAAEGARPQELRARHRAGEV